MSMIMAGELEGLAEEWNGQVKSFYKAGHKLQPRNLSMRR